MLMPSIFGEDMFDEFMRGFPFFDNSAENNVEKKLYGHNAKNVMKTDIKELEGGYELEIDLPGFTKEEVTAELKDGYLTISAAKGLDKDEQEKETGKYIRRDRAGHQGRVQAWYAEAVCSEEGSKTGCRNQEICYH